LNAHAKAFFINYYLVSVYKSVSRRFVIESISASRSSMGYERDSKVQGDTGSLYTETI
jgi:hypothetical protein